MGLLSFLENKETKALREASERVNSRKNKRRKGRQPKRKTPRQMAEEIKRADEDREADFQRRVDVYCRKWNMGGTSRHRAERDLRAKRHLMSFKKDFPLR